MPWYDGSGSTKSCLNRSRRGPVERAAVHDDAADGRAVAADPLGGRVDDDVGAVLDRLREQRREGVVHDDRHAAGVGDVGDRRQVVDVEARVADQLEEDRLGLLVDRPPEGRRIGAVHEGRGDADLGQRVGEQVVGPAVERRRADEVVAGAGEVEDRERLGRLAGGHAERGHAALERGDPLLEDVRRRVHDPGVDVPELLEPEQPRRVRGVVEDVARGRVDRARPGRSSPGRASGPRGGPGSPGGRWSDRALPSSGSVPPWWVSAGKQKRPRLLLWSRGPGTGLRSRCLHRRDCAGRQTRTSRSGRRRIHMSERRVITARRSCTPQPSGVNVRDRNATLARATRPATYDSRHDRDPRRVPRLRRREGRPGRRRLGRARRSRRSARRTCPPARSRSASSGRASTTRTGSPRAPTARSPGSARSSPASTSPAR